MNIFLRIITIIVFCLIVSGCSSTNQNSNFSNRLTPEQLSLLKVSRDYILPKRTIPSVGHNDPQINSAMFAMQKLALQQGLIFDGAKSSEGFVVVGKEGKNGQMVLILLIYKAPNGMVAFQDTHRWKAVDMSSGLRMRDRFLNELR